MYLAQDTKYHLIGATIVAVSMVLFYLVAQHVSHALSLAVAGPLFAWGLERYQAIRREGAFEYRDMLATAAPFELIAAGVWWFKG